MGRAVVRWLHWLAIHSGLVYFAQWRKWGKLQGAVAESTLRKVSCRLVLCCSFPQMLNNTWGTSPELWISPPRKNIQSSPQTPETNQTADSPELASSEVSLQKVNRRRNSTRSCGQSKGCWVWNTLPHSNSYTLKQLPVGNQSFSFGWVKLRYADPAFDFAGKVKLKQGLCSQRESNPTLNFGASMEICY